jgi:hypothetical protein
MRRLCRRATVFSSWAGAVFMLYLCFISTVDGPELVAGALIALGAGALATVALETAGRAVVSGAWRWYAPAAVWPLDFVTDCVLLARVVAGRALGAPRPAGGIRTLRLQPGIPAALAGFWLSSTPGGCVVGAQGSTLTVHCLSDKPSRVERILAATPREGG